MKIPNKIYVSLRYTTNSVYGYLVVADKEHTKYYQKNKLNADKRAGAKHKEMYIDNKAKDGFRIESYSYDTGYSILHPDGFTFSVSPSNLFDLIRTSTLINGEIPTKLYFDDELNLISEISEILADKKEKEEIAKTVKETVKELKFNDEIKLNSYGKNDYVYIGRYHALTSAKNSEVVAKSSKLVHLVYNKTKLKYEIKNNLDQMSLVDGVINNNHFTESQDEVLEDALGYLKSNTHYNSSYNVVGVIALQPKPIKITDLKKRFVPCKLSKLEFSHGMPKYSVLKTNDQYQVILGLYTVGRNGFGYSNNFKCNYEEALAKGNTCKMRLWDIDFDGETPVYTNKSSSVYNIPSSELFSIDLTNTNYEFGYMEYYL